MNPKPGMELDSSAPIYVIELGSGCGKFCFFMLKVRIYEIAMFAMYLSLPSLTLCCCCNQALNELESMLPVPFAKVRGARVYLKAGMRQSGAKHYISHVLHINTNNIWQHAERLGLNMLLLWSWNPFAPPCFSFTAFVTWLAARHLIDRKLCT